MAERETAAGSSVVGVLTGVAHTSATLHYYVTHCTYVTLAAAAAGSLVEKHYVLTYTATGKPFTGRTPHQTKRFLITFCLALG